MLAPRIDLEALYSIPCRFGCDTPVVAVIHAPDGCICWSDPIQALCAQHLLSAQSVGPVNVVLDYRIPK